MAKTKEKTSLKDKLMNILFWVVILSIFPLLNQNPEEDISTRLMTTPRYEHVSVAYDDKIYTFGGRFENKVMNSAEVYDPVSEESKSIAPMLVAVDTPAVTVYKDKIYIIGGMNENADGIDTVQIYDPKTDSWTYGKPTLHKRYDQVAVVYKDNIYLDGYQSEKKEGNSLEKYNPSKDEWQYLDMDSSSPHCNGVLINNKLLTFATQISSDEDLYIFDLDTYEGYSSSKAPDNFYEASIASKDHMVYITSGKNLLIYNYNLDTWEQKSSPSVKRYFSSSVIIKDKLYITGGRSNGGSNGHNLGSIEVYDIANDKWLDF